MFRSLQVLLQVLLQGDCSHSSCCCGCCYKSVQSKEANERDVVCDWTGSISALLTLFLLLGIYEIKSRSSSKKKRREVRVFLERMEVITDWLDSVGAFV